jgi:hypothetical protein
VRCISGSCACALPCTRRNRSHGKEVGFWLIGLSQVVE